MSATEQAGPTMGPEMTAEQRAAVEARDRDVFCEAGAGSGKTRVLAERYCEAVDADGVEIDAILAFTFTERAAGELRRRVRRELMRRSRAALAGDHDRARELADLARATERSWVMTIHAFCRRLLGAHPLAAGLDPRFRVLDEGEARRVRDRALAEALDEVSAAGGEAVTRALAAYRPYRLGEMAVSLYERLRSQGMASPRLPQVPGPVVSARLGEDAPAPLTADQAEAATAARAALEALVEALDRRYQAHKQARSALDFGDLELEALGLLQRSKAVAAHWRERFAHVLVDEFQDTNRVQVDLIEALRGPQTRLFVVGDEQQSIYRFRNADLEVFQEHRVHAGESESTASVQLRGNFRSTPAILAAVNVIGEALIDGYQPLTAGAPAPGAAPVELLLTHDPKAGNHARWADFATELQPPQAETNLGTVAEARALAERLRELVAAGEIERGETVVLLRAFTHVDAYAEALARAGLDPYIVGGRGYWSQQQVEDMIRLLGTIANPLDDEALFGALACPAVGVSPDALWLLRQATGEHRHVWPTVQARFGGSAGELQEGGEEWLAAIDVDDAERLGVFCTRLAGLRAAAPVLRLEELVERAMNAFDYDLELLARRDGAGRMANVRKLMRLARDFEGNDGRDLAGFLAAAEASTRRDEREGMAPVTAEGHDGVRVMTVHAAKGLEFEVVAVPDLARGLAAGSRPGDVVIAASANGGGHRFGMRLAFPTADSVGLWEFHELTDSEKRKDSDEGARLVYVAATRARRRLLLSGIYRESDLEAADERKPTDSPIRRLLPALVSRGWTGGDDELADPPLRIALSGPGAERASELARAFEPPARPAPGGEGEGLAIDTGPRPVPLGHLSYSSLADYERCGYRFYAERVIGLAPAAQAPDDEHGPDERDAALEPVEGAETAGHRARSLAFGNAVHAALEWSARNDWAEPPPPHMEALFAAAGPQSAQRAGELIAGWLSSPLLAELRGTRLAPEVPFALPLGGTIVRGKIDLLAFGATGPVVVDFKTDRIGEGGGVAAAGERYRAQRELYALVAAEAADEPGAVRAIHLFLEAPAEPVVETMGPLELEASRERLAALVGRMRAGEYEPTGSPSVQVCFGCPAAANLCPHPAWRPRK